MFPSFKSLFRSSAKSARSSRTSLKCEALETRWVPATVGATKFAIIDFDGENQVTAAQFAEGGWTGNKALPTQPITSFRALFNNTTNSRLDMNGNGVVNSTDADLAISRILAKVRQDYAPYRISIISGDQDTFQNVFSDAVVGDGMIIANGAGAGFVPGSTNAFGVAPRVDAGNTDDEMAFVFGGNILAASANGNDFVNRMARTISHELGHTFGLEHITNTNITDAQSHNLMSVPVDVNGDGDTGDAGEEARDFSRDFGFQDLFFNTDAGSQNSHQMLSQENVLGRSLGTWVAVLRPGELTASGSSGADNIQVKSISPTLLRVFTNSSPKTVEVNASGVLTLNMFDAPISRINVLGQGGNDTLSVNANITLPTFMDGGIGNDTMFGGSGRDTMLGGIGNDRMFGNAGDDRLFGQDGTDFLSGGGDNDRLSGGDDNDRDTLNGGSGIDVFVQVRSFFPFGGSEELLQDRTSIDTVIFEGGFFSQF